MGVSCFSLAFWENVCILIIVVIALWMIIQLFIPYVTQFLPAIVIKIVEILVKAGIAIICVLVIFGLLACIWSAFGGMHLGIR